MATLYQIAVIALFMVSADSLRLFMIGGHAYEHSNLYNDLGRAVPGRQPMPGNCPDSWQITKCPRVGVITSSHETEQQGNDTYSVDDDVSLSYEHIFLKFGMSPRHISVHADNYRQTVRLSTERGKLNLQIIENADILYLTGGDQSKHIRAWLNDDGSESQLLAIIKKRAFNDEVIVAGSSAGAMIYDENTFGQGSTYGTIYFANSVGLAPKQVSDAAVNGTNLADVRNGTDCLQYFENGGKMSSFNWLDMVVDPHFHAEGRVGQIVPIMVDLKRTMGLGIDENTSLFYQNGQGQVYGEQGVTIFDLSEAIIYPTKYFRLQNAKVHYLTEGDRYDFHKKVVSSSKPLITTPQFKDKSDSDDIFGSQEGKRLLTRLVDQTALFNRGRSIIPDGYPADAPIFELTFRKNAQTKGYRMGGAYTVVSAIIDYSYIITPIKKSLLRTQ